MPPLLLVSRAIRWGSVAAVLAMLLGVVAVQAFLERWGAMTSSAVVVSVRPDDPLSRAVTVQTSRGLVCSPVPAVTDVVLLQDTGRDRVSVVTLGQAVTASADGRGRIRSYCV